MTRLSQTALLLLVSVVGAPVLVGQTSLSLAPVQTEIILNPGKSGVQKLVIGNGSPSPVQIQAEISAWTIGRPGLDVFPSAGAEGLTGKDWFRLESSDFTVPAGEQRTISVSISVPENAEPGQYTASLSFRTVAENEPGDPAGGLSLQGKLTALAMVTVGKPRDAGTVVDMALERKDGRAFFILRRKNAGRFFLPTEGEIILRDARGKKAITAEFVDDPVPPLSERIFRIPIEGKLAAGRYEAECVLRLLSGKKTAEKRPVVID